MMIERIKFSRDNEYLIIYYKDQPINFKKSATHLKDGKYVIDVKKQPALKENFVLEEGVLAEMHKTIYEYVKKSGVWVTFID